MTLAENVGLPLEEFTDLRPAEIREIAFLKLALVGLKGFEDYYPSEISGGMQKRASLARAMAWNAYLNRGAMKGGSASGKVKIAVPEIRHRMAATVPSLFA